MNLAIVDMDGTVADNTHRQHLVTGPKADWRAFLAPALVALDAPIPLVKEALENFHDAGWRVIFLTGRNENLRETSSEWLFRHYGFDANQRTLFMRPNGESSKATDYKGRMLHHLKKEFGPHPTLIYIDDNEHMMPVALEHGAITLYAPGCWKALFHDPGELPHEELWRK